MRYHLIFAAAIGSVVAFPAEPTLAARAVDCGKVTGALSVLKNLGPPATTFCSSFLKVPATQTVVSTTIPTVTSVTSTSTITTTSSVCPLPDVVQRPKNRGVAMRFAEPEAEPEAAPVVNVLPLLAAFAQAKISEGCSCLNIKPKATTIMTKTAAPTTTKIVSTTTACTTPPLKDNGACCSDQTLSSLECQSGACCFIYDASAGQQTCPKCNTQDTCGQVLNLTPLPATNRVDGAQCTANNQCENGCCYNAGICQAARVCRPQGTKQQGDICGSGLPSGDTACQSGQCCDSSGLASNPLAVCNPVGFCDAIRSAPSSPQLLSDGAVCQKLSADSTECASGGCCSANGGAVLTCSSSRSCVAYVPDNSVAIGGTCSRSAQCVSGCCDGNGCRSTSSCGKRAIRFEGSL